MGLGPPVCTNCMVIYDYKHSYGWECPVCKLNDPHNQDSLWAMKGFNMNSKQDTITPQLEANRRFYDFMMREDGGDVSSFNG